MFRMWLLAGRTIVVPGVGEMVPACVTAAVCAITTEPTFRTFSPRVVPVVVLILPARMGPEKVDEAIGCLLHD
jgi:hypothetical protein